jgi:7,8-dihydropterin-6-yl-methyl-4-(beta-D-ribofuranosyl)aminobenzene 5'-phosphate synthase
MKVTILTDNNTIIDRYFLGEPAFSAYIEDENCKLLFDTGYSDVFLKNAQKMNIDLSSLDFAAFSHGHCDHTWGLDFLIRYFCELEFEGKCHKKPILFAHPATFKSITAEGYSEIGSILSENKLEKFFKMQLKKEPQKITDRLLFLGEIPRNTGFEGKQYFGKKENETDNDYVMDDSAVVYQSSGGLIIITGCSHSGICNIIEYAKKLTRENRILDIIGGFHLQNPSDIQMQGTLEYLKNQNIKRIHPCHCTDLKSKIKLAGVVSVEETGSGLQLEYEN